MLQRFRGRLEDYWRFPGVWTGRVTRSLIVSSNQVGGVKASSGPAIGGPRISSTDDGKWFNDDDNLLSVSLSRSLASAIRNSFLRSDTLVFVGPTLFVIFGWACSMVRPSLVPGWSGCRDRRLDSDGSSR